MHRWEEQLANGDVGKEQVRMAADQGDEDAIELCACFYITGDYGYEIDLEKARKYALLLEQTGNDASFYFVQIYILKDQFEYAYHACRVALKRGRTDVFQDMATICRRLCKEEEAALFSEQETAQTAPPIDLSKRLIVEEPAIYSEHNGMKIAGLIFFAVLIVGFLMYDHANHATEEDSSASTYEDVPPPEANYENEPEENYEEEPEEHTQAEETPSGSSSQRSYANNSFANQESSSSDYEEEEEEEEDEGEEESAGDFQPGEYVFPNSDTELLTKEDLKGLSKEMINLAKNELYARHGRIFERKDLQDWFESCRWYYGEYTREEWDAYGDKYFFNEIEIKNRNLLVKYEKKASK